jgi:1-deoxy-D-xylulose-5-phosphate reductoisomerase
MRPRCSAMRRNVVILGSTGSIGRQTLDVTRQYPELVAVYGLAAATSRVALEEQIAAWKPAAVAFPGGRASLSVPEGTDVLDGEAGMVELVQRPEVDLVVVGTVGRAGLLPTLAALRAGKLVALANKEVLVMAGDLIRRELAVSEGALVPIDSEHSAIWQCLQGEPARSIETLTLTASGGALRGLPERELAEVTPEQALRHPTWSMGDKITVDSANLMNKGLEVIEAHWLFDVPMDQIDVVLHPQSIVHSLVTFDDGSTKAQLGLPDMRLPIQYALSHPERWVSDLPRLNLATCGALTFASIALDAYPALRMALEAGALGGIYPTLLCAADDIAVAAFLDRQIAFTRIPLIISRTLELAASCPNPDLDDILEADAWGRRTARTLVAS